MKARYLGYEIIVTRAKSMGGDTLLYYAIFRDWDGWECASGYSTGSETVKEFMGHMKARVDAELKDDDPWGEIYFGKCL